ncbi:phospholipid:diacylglycerol acyltransferase, putative, partial [Trypanosoma cruzi marinkellei]
MENQNSDSTCGAFRTVGDVVYVRVGILQLRQTGSQREREREDGERERKEK